MILGKAFKPKRLNEDAFRLELLNAMRAVAVEVKKDFEATTETWQEENKPKFDSLISLTGGGPSLVVDVASNGEIYRYVNDGTKPHLIPKGGPGTLAFSEGYTAKTAPGVIGSRSGGSSGARIIRKTQIKHPGTEARNFDKAIAKKWEKPFKRAMEAALKKAVKASGHGG